MKKKYYGIKFPFTLTNNENIFIDLNNNLHEKIASEIAHTILTPKGSRIRKPNFGTDLIEFIYSPNDDITWTDVESEIRKSVELNVPNCIINNVKLINNETDENNLILSVDFGVKKGNSVENNKMFIKI